MNRELLLERNDNDFFIPFVQSQNETALSRILACFFLSGTGKC